MVATLTDNIQTVPILTAIILLPGLVLVVVKNKFRASRKVDSSQQLLQYAVASLTCWGTVGVLFWNRVSAIQDLGDVSRSDVVVATLALFASASLYGALAGLWNQADVGSWLLSRLNIRSVRACVSAWDRAFERKRGCLVRVEMTDGQVVFATFGPASAVASGTLAEERDLFFEKTWIQTPSGELDEQVGSLGIWLHSRDIRSIRLFDISELAQDATRQRCQQRPSPTSAEPASGHLDVRVVGRPLREQDAHATAGSSETKSPYRQSRQPEKVNA